MSRYMGWLLVACVAACSSNDSGSPGADRTDAVAMDVSSGLDVANDDAFNDAEPAQGDVPDMPDVPDIPDMPDIPDTSEMPEITEDVVASDTTVADDTDAGDAGCVAGCGDRACGEDLCGNYCGRCAFELECNAQGACVTPASICGDGVVGRDETCDPGPDGPVEGCSTLCQTDFGYSCEGEPSTCRQRDLDEAGNLCSNPIVLEGGKFFAFLGNAGPFNSYHPWYGACLTDGFGTPSFGPDIVYALWLNAGQTVVAQMRSFVIPTTLAISNACGDDDPIDYVLNEACVAIAQNRDLGTWTELRWTATDNGWVYVITGAPGTRDIGPFELAISRE